MKKINAPVEGNVVGTIVKIDHLPAVNYEKIQRDAVVVSIEDLETGKVTQMFLGELMVSEFGMSPLFFDGNVLNLSTETRKAGETQYIDANGDVHFHGELNNAPKGTISTVVRNAFNASAITMMKKGVPAEYINALQERRERHIADYAGRTPSFHAIRGAVENVASQIEKLNAKLATEGLSPAVREQIEKRIAQLSEAN